MNKDARSQLTLGLILILLGAWFIVDKSLPAVHEMIGPWLRWPANMILIGAAIFLFGWVSGNPGMSVPAAIVAGLGGIFYYQQLTDNSSSWSYMWALIPGFVGVGTVLTGLLGERTAHNLKHGVNLIVISVVLFLVFGSYLGGLSLLGKFGPAVLIILLGLWVLGSGLYKTFRGRDL